LRREMCWAVFDTSSVCVWGRSPETVNATWRSPSSCPASVDHRYGNGVRLFIVTSAQITSRKPASMDRRSSDLGDGRETTI